jgi:hypothetical protein
VNYRVEDVAAALLALVDAGCRVVAGPFPIAIGKCAVITDPFGNSLTLVDMTKGAPGGEPRRHLIGVPRITRRGAITPDNPGERTLSTAGRSLDLIVRPAADGRF